MTEERVAPLRQRMMEDMRIRGMGDKPQKSHIRAIKDFAAFLGRSPDTATPEDLRAYQLHMSPSPPRIPPWKVFQRGSRSRQCAAFRHDPHQKTFTLVEVRRRCSPGRQQQIKLRRSKTPPVQTKSLLWLPPVMQEVSEPKCA